MANHAPPGAHNPNQQCQPPNFVVKEQFLNYVAIFMIWLASVPLIYLQLQPEL